MWRLSSKEAAARRQRAPDGKCKKHLKHQQSPGVCSICLTEKLSQLSSTAAFSSRGRRAKMGSSSCSSSAPSYDSSSSVSSCSSAMRRYRYANEGKGSLSLFLVSGSKNVLTKSRSVANFVPRTRGNSKDDDASTCHQKIKKGGFLSKLLRRPRSKTIEEEGLGHSRTLRDHMLIITT